MPHSVSIEDAVGCRGCLLHAHGGQVKELVHDLGGDRFDRPPLALGEPSEPRLGLPQLRRPDLLRPGAQGRDRRDDVERGLPRVKPLGFRSDDPLGALRLPPPPRERLRHDGLEIVEVVEVAAVQSGDLGVEVTRHGEVDEEERAAAAAA